MRFINKFNNRFFKLFNLLLLLSIFQFTAFAKEKINSEELEGYQVKFDYENYPEEREIAYQYFIDRFPEEQNGEFIINKEEIGIDLYDIDEDHEKEVIIYLMPKKNVTYYCPDKIGCPFAILKKINQFPYYLEIQWRGDEDYASHKMLRAGIRILKKSSNKYHDILTENPNRGPMQYWQWQGDHYLRLE